MRTARSRWAPLAAGLALGVLAAGCTITPAGSEPTTAASGSGTGGTGSSGPSATGGGPGGTTVPGPSGATGGTTGSGEPTTAGGGAAYPGVGSACVTSTFEGLSRDERLGQLFMVGMQPGQAPAGLDDVLARQRVGAVIYLGGWTGQATIRSTSAHLQGSATPGVGLFIAADQEGGAVQQLKGAGFTNLPAARVQGQQSPETLHTNAARTGRELRAVGVNVDLAPVADTVPASMLSTNQPIGRFGRQYSTDPAVVARAVPAVVEGLQSAGVVATVKHFPGLGRVTGNTDLTATGITDSTTGPGDAYLGPFSAGIDARVGLVMVSSARYPLLDPTGTQAVFSRPIVTGLLRETMGWQGVVVSDDIGAAAAVATVPASDRAVRFLAAGGDLVLTARADQVQGMIAAIRSRADQDGAFGAAVELSVKRVLAVKERFGLLRCG